MDKENRRLEELLAQQASQWIETLRDPSAQQRAAFVAWLKESPRNVRDFLLMLTIDQTLDNVDAERLHDIGSLLAAADTRVVDFPGTQIRRKAVGLPRRRWKAAAIAAGVALASVMSWLASDYRSPHWTEFETATGEQRAFELEDGSVVHLNTHSRAAIRFSEHARDVRLLHGEALFRVHHDASRPFRVYTADAIIQAVGTQFNVYERPEGTVVAVIEGRVSVEGAPAANAATAPMRIAISSAHHSAAAASAPAGLIVRSSEEAKINHAGNVSVQAGLDVAEAGRVAREASDLP